MSGRIFPLTAQAAYNIVTSAAERAGIAGAAPHDLRRSAAKLWRKGGASLEQISKVLGHASVKTTELYIGAQLELERGKAATDAIDWTDERGSKSEESSK